MKTWFLAVLGWSLKAKRMRELCDELGMPEEAAAVIECRFIRGLNVDQTAAACNVSPAQQKLIVSRYDRKAICFYKTDTEWFHMAELTAISENYQKGSKSPPI